MRRRYAVKGSALVWLRFHAFGQELTADFVVAMAAMGETEEVHCREKFSRPIARQRVELASTSMPKQVAALSGYSKHR